MSVDPIGNLENTPDEPKKRRTIKGHIAKLRVHLLTTSYKQDVADKLNKLFAAGHIILSVTASSDVRGFEIISYTEE